MTILYLVHDLRDAAVRRRVRFLREGGATVALFGFERQAGAGAGARPEGQVLGSTRNGEFGQRIAATIRAALFSRRWRGAMRDSEVIVARTLEMLLIAVLVRARLRLSTPIVYECLDIHRLMTNRGPAGRVLRWIEQRLLDRSALLIVSSPRFIDRYFEQAHRRLPRWMLLENKLLGSDLAPGASEARRPDGPPWRIGWLGILRCRRSLALLADLVRTAGGAVQVDIHGRPALDAIPDFHDIVAATPGMTFHGGYDRATDLGRLYGGVHFNWTLDFYEAGFNSEWLLPNRLYEGGMFGAVPLALGTVQTGRWVADHDCGVLLTEPLPQALQRFFAGLDATAYAALQARVARLDPMALTETADTAARFVESLRALRAGEHRRGPAPSASERYGTT